MAHGSPPGLIEAVNDPPEQPVFRFFPTTPPLAHFVEYLFCSHVPRQFVNQVEAMRLPEVAAQLVFAIEEGHAFPGGIAIGDGLRACLFFQPAHLEVIPIASSIRQAVGAALRPTGLGLLLPKGAGLLVDAPLIALEDLWGAEGHELLLRMVAAATPERRCALLESYLQARASRANAPGRTAARAFELMRAAHGEVSTERVAKACGCTSRTLRNLALAEAGLAPKHMARVLRIRHALDLLVDAGVPLSMAAATSAFSDHAHMSREFRELLGSSPSQLGQRLRSAAVPSFSAERNLVATGLLLMPKTNRS